MKMNAEYSFKVLFFAATALLSVSVAGASPTSLGYQGRIVKTDGQPLEYANVSFYFQVTSPGGSCVLYEEQIDGINMVNSKGIFDISIGTGARQFPTSGGTTALDSFNNSALSLPCKGGGSFVPSVNSERLLRVQFHDGSGWKQIHPDTAIRSVPFASYALRSAQVGEFRADQLLIKDTIPTCANHEFLSWSGVAFVCEAVSGVGGGTVTEIQSTNSYVTVTNATSTPTITLNVGTTANTVAAGNDARFTNARTPMGPAGGDLSGTYPDPVVDKIQGVPLDATPPSTNQVLTYDGAKWIARNPASGNPGTVTGITAGTGLTGGTINSAGTIGLEGPLLGLHNMNSNGYIFRNGADTYGSTPASSHVGNNNLVMRDGTGTSAFYGVNYAGATSGSVLIKAADISANYSLTLPDTEGAANQVLMTSGTDGILSWANVPSAPGAACNSGDVLTYDGSAFTCVPDQVGSSGGGISTLNGQNGSSQSFGTPGISGTAPAWSSNSGVHTLNIPMASSAGVTAGLISKTQYDALSSKQAALGYTPLNPANNLSDVSSVTTARNNLGLGSLATASSIAGQALTNNQVWIGNSSDKAAARYLGIGDIRNASGNSQLVTNCSASQTMTWSSANDSYVCSTITIGSANISDGSIAASDIATGAVTDVKISSVSVGKIDSASGAYFGYKPNNSACTNGQVLSWDNTNSRWICGTNYSGTLTNIATGTGLTGGPITTSGTLAVDVGTTSNKILQLNSSAQIPAVSGALLTNLNASNIASGTLVVGRLPAFTGDVTASAGTGALSIATGAVTDAKISNVSVGKIASASGAYFGYKPNNAACANGQVLSWDNANSRWVCGTNYSGTVTNVATGTGLTGGPITTSGTLAVDVGTTANKILQLNSSAQIPAVSGALLTNLNASNIASGTLAVGRLPAFTGGDVTSSTGTGALNIVANAVTSSKLAANSVNSSKIADLSIVDADLATSLSNRIPSGGNGSHIWHTTGRFGLGTSAPSYLLDVVSSGATFARLKGNGDGTNYAGLVLESDSDKRWLLSHHNAYTNALVFQHYDGSAWMTGLSITPDGNVGIGTGVPSNKFNIRFGTNIALDDPSSGYILLGATTGTNIVLDNDEIQSRNNGAAYTLHMQAKGGNIALVNGGGRVGIGTTSPSDRLHVAGDIRVGTGTTGCVKDADGTVISGTCSSDARFKKDIISLDSKLDQIVHLRPVTYHWRAEEFPNKHFGTQLETGLIAQEVQKEIPELVVTDDEGFLRIRFSELNIYVLQALKEFYHRWFNDSQELHREIASLRAENIKIKDENATQEAKLKEVEMRLEKIEKAFAERVLAPN